MNIYRDDPKSFNTSESAIPLSYHAVSKGYDQDVPFLMRQFFFLPLMHSEKLVDQEESLKLFRDTGSYDYAQTHYDVVLKYGRFPGRNQVMGRTSTAAELEYLANGGVF